MKRKYYWIQFIPIIGIIWILARPNAVWSTRFKPTIVYHGGIEDFYMGILIQAATFISIAIWIVQFL